MKILRALLVLIVVANAALILKGVIITVDSIRYLYAAQTLPDPRHLIGNEHFSIQPLLFPMYLRFFSFFGETGQGVILTVANLLLYLATLFFGFRTFRLFASKNNPMLYLATIILACSYGVLHVYNYLWSEALFLPILSANIYFLARHTVRQRQSDLLIALLLSGLLPVIRYIGIFMILFNGLYLLYLLLKKRLNITVVLVAALSLLPFLANIGFNYLNSGTLAGGERGEGKFSFFSNLVVTSISLVKTSPFPLSEAYVFTRQHLFLAILIALSVLAVLIWSFRSSRPSFRLHPKFYHIELSLLAMLFLYVLLLSFFSTINAFDPIDLRLVAPVVIPCFILLGVLVMQVQFTGGYQPVMFLAVIIIALFGVRLATAFENRNVTWNKLPSGLLYRHFDTNQNAGSIVREKYRAGKKIYTNDPYRTMLFYGVPSEFLPEIKYYNSKTLKFTEDQARKLVSGDENVVVIYNPAELKTFRFYPLEVYISGKNHIVQNADLIIRQ